MALFFVTGCGGCSGAAGSGLGVEGVALGGLALHTFVLLPLRGLRIRRVFGVRMVKRWNGM